MVIRGVRGSGRFLLELRAEEDTTAGSIADILAGFLGDRILLLGVAIVSSGSISISSSAFGLVFLRGRFADIVCTGAVCEEAIEDSRM